MQMLADEPALQLLLVLQAQRLHARQLIGPSHERVLDAPAFADD